MEIKQKQYRQPIQYESDYKIDENNRIDFTVYKQLKLLNERVEAYHNTIYKLLEDRNRSSLFGFSMYENTLLKLQDDHIMSLIERIKALEEENQSFEQRLNYYDRQSNISTRPIEQDG